MEANGKRKFGQKNLLPFIYFLFLYASKRKEVLQPKPFKGKEITSQNTAPHPKKPLPSAASKPMLQYACPEYEVIFQRQH